MNYNEIKTNELEIRNYDEVVGYAGRIRKPMIDYVTEFTFISEENLTLEQFQVVLEGKGAYGCLKFFKKVMNFANGKKLYKHICKAVMF